jgi:hypothetical protein
MLLAIVELLPSSSLLGLKISSNYLIDTKVNAKNHSMRSEGIPFPVDTPTGEQIFRKIMFNCGSYDTGKFYLHKNVDVLYIYIYMFTTVLQNPSS